MSDKATIAAINAIAVKAQALEITRLERALLASDGWRCGGCERVFDNAERDYSVFDNAERDYGEDCSLCVRCLEELRHLPAVKP